MVGGVEGGVVSGVESRPGIALRLRLLGPLAVLRGGVAQALPPSRKVRALIGHLALAPLPVARGRLCELLWDAPNDPRGELRWCLSKARAVLDEPGHAHLLADADSVRLDLDGADIDARELQRAVQGGLEGLAPQALEALLQLCRSDFLEGLEIERSVAWTAWLTAQRRYFRAARVALQEQLARRLDPASDAALAAFEGWLQSAPFDRQAHAGLLDALARRGRLREGDEHLAAAARAFEAEGRDWAPIGHAWRAAKERHASPLASAAPDVPAAGSAAALPCGTAEPAALPASPRGGFEADAAAPLIVLANDAGDRGVRSAPAGRQRASLAVMPFADLTRHEGPRGGLADGYAYDLITRLAKLRSLFVIAPGSTFALDARQIGPEEAGRALDVDYVAAGTLRRDGGRCAVTVTLAETRSARVVWSDSYAVRGDDALELLDEIGDRIVSSIAHQIEVAERNRAILKPPNSLDAWEAHHRGLWHMYRFNQADNEQARGWFERALQLDPTFARPYAGLSFTHFQNAFLNWGERERAIELAYRSASQGLMSDDLDPAAHWAMGRALWLRGRLDESIAELDSSVRLSPNFALGHYTLAFVHAQSGDPDEAIVESDHSRELSPYDPLLFAMLATRALALMRLGRHDQAADWALRAAARPNAHAHILGIAAHCLALAGRGNEAIAMAAALHRQRPDYRLQDLLGAFRFAEDAETRLRRVTGSIGLG